MSLQLLFRIPRLRQAMSFSTTCWSWDNSWSGLPSFHQLHSLICQSLTLTRSPETLRCLTLLQPKIKYDFSVAHSPTDEPSPSTARLRPWNCPPQLQPTWRHSSDATSSDPVSRSTSRGQPRAPSQMDSAQLLQFTPTRVLTRSTPARRKVDHYWSKWRGECPSPTTRDINSNDRMICDMIWTYNLWFI